MTAQQNALQFDLQIVLMKCIFLQFTCVANRSANLKVVAQYYKFSGKLRRSGQRAITEATIRLSPLWPSFEAREGLFILKGMQETQDGQQLADRFAGSTQVAD